MNCESKTKFATFSAVSYEELGDSAFIIQRHSHGADAAIAADDSDEEDNVVEEVNLHMTDVEYKYESSICSSNSDDSHSNCLSPAPDDANSKFFFSLFD